MNILYYGDNTCYTHSPTKSVLIEYMGNIEIDNKYPDNQIIMESKGRIIISPNTFKNKLNLLKDLFEYNGSFKIINASAVLQDGNLTKMIVKKIDSYSDLLTSNSEDMGDLSQNIGLKKGRSGIKKTTLKVKTISNLNTNKEKRKYFLKDGTEYNGEYHIHLDNLKMMTGSDYTKESQELVNKNGDGLLKNFGKNGIERKNEIPKNYKK